MNQKKKLYIDFDGTIVNSIKAIVSLYNEDFKWYKKFHYIYWMDINTWEFSECNCASPDYISTYFNQERFYNKLEFIDNAKEVLDKLKDDYEITIISMGYSPNLIGKEIWIEKNIPYANFIGINYKKYNDKSHLDLSDGIYIDDNMKNLNTNAKENICFGDVYSWNENWNGERCYNWIELEKYIRERG